MKKALIESWSNTPPMTTSAMQSWLMDSSSFMLRLKEHAVFDACVQVLRETWQVPELSEDQYLQNNGQAALIREVIIRSASDYFMFARTVMTKAILSGELTALSHLNSRSLGSVLFSHPDVVRQAFEFTTVTSNMMLYEKSIGSIPDAFKSASFPARRSIFTLRDKHLLLTEVFFEKAAVYA